MLNVKEIIWELGSNYGGYKLNYIPVEISDNLVILVLFLF